MTDADEKGPTVSRLPTVGGSCSTQAVVAEAVKTTSWHDSWIHTHTHIRKHHICHTASTTAHLQHTTEPSPVLKIKQHGGIKQKKKEEEKKTKVRDGPGRVLFFCRSGALSGAIGSIPLVPVLPTCLAYACAMCTRGVCIERKRKRVGGDDTENIVRPLHKRLGNVDMTNDAAAITTHTHMLARCAENRRT